MENKLPVKFNPVGFQTESNGLVHMLTDLSRDDLLQVACECMMTIEMLDELHSKPAEIIRNYRKGKIQPEPGPVEFAIARCKDAADAVRDIDRNEVKHLRLTFESCISDLSKLEK